MNLRAISVAPTVAIIAVACGPRERPLNDGDLWVGSITTEGNVTTVVNESGSVWGGTATAVEEASIGVETGEQHYMFGRIISLTAGDDRIYVGERRPAVLHVYDFEGIHIRDIGGEGQGPGEFSSPSGISLTAEGNVLVRDDRNSRFTLFTPDGELLETWAPMSGGFGTSTRTVIGPGGEVYAPAPVGRDPETGSSIWGYRQRGPDGPIGEPLFPPTFDYEQPVLTSGGFFGSVPFHPSPVTELAPFGAWISGLGEEYRFEIRHFDGRVTIVERAVEPVPVTREEREWQTRVTTVRFREEDPSWRWTGPAVPGRKPFFDNFFADYSNRIWVRTHAPSTRIADCNENPEPDEPYSRCWQRNFGYDVFDIDGRYLGAFEPPAELANTTFSYTYIRDDVVIKLVVDDDGTFMVKRYRLVLPGEEVSSAR